MHTCAHTKRLLVAIAYGTSSRFRISNADKRLLVAMGMKYARFTKAESETYLNAEFMPQNSNPSSSSSSSSSTPPARRGFACTIHRWLHRGATMSDVADRYRVSVGFVHKVVTLLRSFFSSSATGAVSDDEPKDRVDALVEALAEKPRGGARTSRTVITEEHVDFLRVLVGTPSVVSLSTCAQLGARLVREFRGRGLTSIAPSTISRTLRFRLGYSLKYAQIKNARRVTQVNVERYQRFARAHFHGVQLRRDLHRGRRRGSEPAVAPLGADPSRDEKDMKHWRSRIDPSRLFFVDESGFNLSVSRRKRGWSRLGESLVFAGDQDRGPHHTLAVVVGSAGGVVARAWKRSGRARGEGFTRTEFVSLLRGGFARAVRRHRAALPAARRNETLFLVMDNASVHKGDAVERALRGSGVEPIYLPPYCPEFNPCELVFAQVKGAMRRAGEVVAAARAVRSAAVSPGGHKSAVKARSEWLRARVLHHLADVTPDLVRSFCDHCAWRPPRSQRGRTMSPA